MLAAFQNARRPTVMATNGNGSDILDFRRRSGDFRPMPRFRIEDRERNVSEVVEAQDAEDALMRYIAGLGYTSLEEAADLLGLGEQWGANISIEEIE
jgi:hypothetical protein